VRRLLHHSLLWERASESEFPLRSGKKSRLREVRPTRKREIGSPERRVRKTSPFATGPLVRAHARESELRSAFRDLAKISLVKKKENAIERSAAFSSRQSHPAVNSGRGVFNFRKVGKRDLGNKTSARLRSLGSRKDTARGGKSARKKSSSTRMNHRLPAKKPCSPGAKEIRE